MALQSVQTQPTPSIDEKGTANELWLIGGDALTIVVDKDCAAFPPERKHLEALNRMIQDLARGAKAVHYRAKNDSETDPMHEMNSLEGIHETIVLLTQLAESVQSELKKLGD